MQGGLHHHSARDRETCPSLHTSLEPHWENLLSAWPRGWEPAGVEGGRTAGREGG